MRQPGERDHGLDALRAVAILLVVVLHGAVPYLDPPLGRLPWAVRDSASSPFLTHVFWWLHSFLMPLFFVIAGFFAAPVVAQRGARAFLRQRFRRILVPCLLGGAVLLPVTFYIFAAGWWLGGASTWNEIRRVKFAAPIQSELFGPAHLWFLQYLFIYCVLYWAWAIGRSRLPPRAADTTGWRARLLDSRWRSLWCAVPTALIIAVDPNLFTTHRNSFVPSPLRLSYYGVFFAAGVCLYGADLTRYWRREAAYLGASLPLVLGVPWLVRAHQAVGLSAGERVLLALAVSLCAWSTIFGCLAACSATVTRPRAAVRYVADAAYWIYLIHMPILAALQIALAYTAAPPVLECAVAVALTASLCLWSYERWVRATAIGALLNGSAVAATYRSPRRMAPAAQPRLAPAPVRRRAQRRGRVASSAVSRRLAIPGTHTT